MRVPRERHRAGRARSYHYMGEFTLPPRHYGTEGTICHGGVFTTRTTSETLVAKHPKVPNGSRTIVLRLLGIP